MTDRTDRSRSPTRCDEDDPIAQFDETDPASIRGGKGKSSSSTTGKRAQLHNHIAPPVELRTLEKLPNYAARFENPAGVAYGGRALGLKLFQQQQRRRWGLATCTQALCSLAPLQW